MEQSVINELKTEELFERLEDEKGSLTITFLDEKLGMGNSITSGTGLDKVSTILSNIPPPFWVFSSTTSTGTSSIAGISNSFNN